MADNNFAFPIPKDVLEPFIKEAVATSIINALGDGTKLITQAVQETLRTKVNANGNISRYSSENKYTMLDVLAQKEIKKIVVEVIKESVEEMRPRIIDGVRKGLDENAENLGDALLDKYLRNIYRNLGIATPITNSLGDDDD